MKNKHIGRIYHIAVITFIILVSAGLTFLSACSSAGPEAAKPIARAIINSGDIVPAKEIRVAEYLQYYEQHFPEPDKDAIGLDLRLGNNRLPAQGCMAWLQIGLQAKSGETTLVAPLNLALVIDRSGSMAAADKMPYVKQSLGIFLQSLNPNDIVSIVTYSDQASVLLPAQPVGDGRWIQKVVDRVQPDASTNLHAGMMLGFQEVEKNFDIHRNNRVLLLTDGIANQGVTDPDKIAADALAYNRKGIYLCTIGLGLDFNDALLIKLAQQGEGGYKFVDSAAEMDRVFREQVTSLKQLVADAVSVKIVPASGVRLIGLTGLDSAPPSEGASVNLWPMNIEDSQVVLAQLQVGQGENGNRLVATVQLEYFDAISQKTIVREKSISGEMVTNLTSYDPTWDLEILRNVTIQNTAEGMREIDRLFNAQKYESAWRIAVGLEQQLTEVARLTGDTQMQDDVALMRKYQKTLADAVWQTEHRTPGLENTNRPQATIERPYRGNTSIPDLPEVNIK
jgi:Ca-activated chloride channel family protein